jgi:hypothetical protein
MATQKTVCTIEGDGVKLKSFNAVTGKVSRVLIARMASRPIFLDVRLPPATCHVPVAV